MSVIVNECLAKESKVGPDAKKVRKINVLKSFAVKPKLELNTDIIDELFVKDDPTAYNFTNGESGGAIVFGIVFLFKFHTYFIMSLSQAPSSVLSRLSST